MFSELASMTENHRAEAERYRAAGWWRDRTLLDDLASHARERPAHPAVIAYEGGQLAHEVSYAELAVLVERFAGALAGLGVGRGDTVVIYTIGLGPTSPAVASGTASPTSPLANVPGNTQVCFGVETPFSPPPCATPSFVGLTPGFVGLYQINVAIPSGVKSGNTEMSVIVSNNVSSSSALIAIQ